VGETQAEKLADWMKTNISEVDKVVSSSLLRAMQTADVIASAYGVTVSLDHRLREDGYSYSDGSPIPDDLLPMNKRTDWHSNPQEPFEASVEGCESYTDLKGRVAFFLDEMIENHLGETVVAVTHGNTINAFFDVIFNTCAFRLCFFPVGNTAISFFEYNHEWELGPWYAHFIAQTPHLDFYPDGID
jgi:broad specificity phosphatase PhoE